MNPTDRSTSELDELIKELSILSSKDGSSKTVVAIRDSLVGIRDDVGRGTEKAVISRRVGGLFRIISDSEFAGTALMDRVLKAVSGATIE